VFARELVARVAGTLALAQARRDALRREEELRAETTSVLESIAEGFLALDRDFRYRYMNAAAEEQAGTTRGAVLGQTPWEAFPGRLGTRIESELRRTMTEREAIRFESNDAARQPATSSAPRWPRSRV
jgi:PAS domain S-box-containing protein